MDRNECGNQLIFRVLDLCMDMIKNCHHDIDGGM